MKYKTPEYKLWKSIKHRCNPSKNISTYEERNNIKMCEEWENSFEIFLKDVGYKPTPLSSLIRIDKRKGFNKENCMWSDRQTDKRQRYVELNGEILLLRDICKQTGLKYTTLLMRLKRKWNIKDAITKPLNYIYNKR